MHASMDITDEIYSRLDEQEVKIRIEQLGAENKKIENTSDEVSKLIKEFLEWRRDKFNCAI